MDNQTSQLKYLQEEIEQQRKTLANFEEDSTSFIRNMRKDNEITNRIYQACEGTDVNTLILRLEQENEDYEKDCIEKTNKKRVEMLEEISYKTKELEMIKEQKRDED